MISVFAFVAVIVGAEPPDHFHPPGNVTVYIDPEAGWIISKIYVPILGLLLILRVVLAVKVNLKKLPVDKSMAVVAPVLGVLRVVT